MGREDRSPKGRSLGKQAIIVPEVTVIFALVFALKFGLEGLVVKPFRVMSASMVPTLALGQQVLVDRVTLQFDRPDRWRHRRLHCASRRASITCGLRHRDDQAYPLSHH